ncbi:MAG: PfkB family carbohydrate kinase, partial [Anaerolineae bacterium]|nr:PfkB family carbohydrate kinase [Anaerolineae bacterium]
CDGRSATAVPTVRETGPIDPVGAGDSALAGIACALAVGASPEEAALVGNLCAAVTIRKIGTTGTASPAEVLERYACLGAKDGS